MRNGQPVAAPPGNPAEALHTAGLPWDGQPRPGNFHAFQTRQADDACGAIRTFGTIVEAPPGPLQFRDQDAIRYVHPSPPPNCARDKVVVYSWNHESCDVACFQVSDSRTSARLVACCNGTAAAAAEYAALTGAPRIAMQVDLPGRHVVEVTTDVDRVTGNAAARVSQLWNRVPFTIDAEQCVDGRSCAVCVNPFNHYLVVQTRPGESAEAFPVGLALDLRQRLGLGNEPLLSRIAVVEPGIDAVPGVKFLTCGDRAHPSAPLSGLAVVAAVAHRLGWTFLQNAARVRTPAGLMSLPKLTAHPDGAICVQFPDVFVDFPPLPLSAGSV
jgi:hypothetical protein